jgi:hypothetical protein
MTSPPAASRALGGEARLLWQRPRGRRREGEWGLLRGGGQSAVELAQAVERAAHRAARGEAKINC